MNKISIFSYFFPSKQMQVFHSKRLCVWYTKQLDNIHFINHDFLSAIAKLVAGVLSLPFVLPGLTAAAAFDGSSYAKNKITSLFEKRKISSGPVDFFTSIKMKSVVFGAIALVALASGYYYFSKTLPLPIPTMQPSSILATLEETPAVSIVEDLPQQSGPSIFEKLKKINDNIYSLHETMQKQPFYFVRKSIFYFILYRMMLISSGRI